MTDPHDIFRAAAEGDLAAIHRYLAAGHSANVSSLAEKWERGSTPLHLACEHGQVEAATALLEAGADINATDRLDHWTPLHRCADEYQADTMRLLLERGAVVDALGSEGETPLHMAAMSGFTEGVRQLLRAGADPNLHEGWAEETALYHAAGNQSLSAARLLLDAGAEVNARCLFGRTALDVVEEDDWYPRNALRDLLLSRGGRTGAELESTTPSPPSVRRYELPGILGNLVNFRTDADQPQEMEACLDYVESILRDNAVPHIQRLGSEGRQQLIAALNTPALADIESGLMLCGHLDVVPGSEEQWEIEDYSGRLYGRGTADMKGSIACFLHLLPWLARQPFPVVLAFTTDEESDMEGIRQLCTFLEQQRIRPALTLLGEPTGKSIGTASSGLYGFRTELHGEAAHSSRPQDGINALYLAARLLTHLEELGKAFAAEGITTNAGRLEGGGDPATVPGHATLHWGYRCLTPEKVETTFRAAWEADVRHLLKLYPGCRVETTATCHFPAFRAGEEATRLAERLARQLGYPQAAIPYTTEAAFLQGAGQRVLLLGAGHPREAHRADESIHADELAGYEEALQAVCRMLAP